ncbi:Uncharacterised protein [Nocardia cyriacigeorgica]|uniref:Uncharacterized protein n=1 Tax=Nocardia cyriacigeorgica TaxID=135487 RepID=A0A4U8W5Z6_9NOCA|nr:Uncharacterised protein [Nocardia cyriacigeorgica]
MAGPPFPVDRRHFRGRGPYVVRGGGRAAGAVGAGNQLQRGHDPVVGEGTGAPPAGPRYRPSRAARPRRRKPPDTEQDNLVRKRSDRDPRRDRAERRHRGRELTRRGRSDGLRFATHRWACPGFAGRHRPTRCHTRTADCHAAVVAAAFPRPDPQASQAVPAAPRGTARTRGRLDDSGRSPLPHYAGPGSTSGIATATTSSDTMRGVGRSARHIPRADPAGSRGSTAPRNRATNTHGHGPPHHRRPSSRGSRTGR